MLPWLEALVPGILSRAGISAAVRAFKAFRRGRSSKDRSLQGVWRATGNDLRISALAYDVELSYSGHLEFRGRWGHWKVAGTIEAMVARGESGHAKTREFNWGFEGWAARIDEMVVIFYNQKHSGTYEDAFGVLFLKMSKGNCAEGFFLARRSIDDCVDIGFGRVLLEKLRD